MNVKLEINGRTIEERLLAVRVWAKRHFSWVRLGSWREERYIFTISITGNAASKVQAWLNRTFDQALRKDLIAEIKASGGNPGEFLDPSRSQKVVDRPRSWWDDLPQTGKVRTPTFDHRQVAHEHSRPSR